MPRCQDQSARCVRRCGIAGRALGLGRRLLRAAAATAAAAAIAVVGAATVRTVAGWHDKIGPEQDAWTAGAIVGAGSGDGVFAAPSTIAGQVVAVAVGCAGSQNRRCDGALAVPASASAGGAVGAGSGDVFCFRSGCDRSAVTSARHHKSTPINGLLHPMPKR